METMEKIRKIVNNNRVRFIETIPTLLFIEGFPGLHHFKREQLKCRLSNSGEYAANSDLLDAMLKVDHFPEQFVTFCDKHECCAELKELILPVLIQSHGYYSAQQNRTSDNSRNGISAAAAFPEPSDETSDATVITQQSCATHAVAEEMDSGNTQNGSSVSSEISNGEVDVTGRDSQIEGAEDNSAPNKDEVCRATAMNNNMDNNLSPHKASGGVKAIFGGPTNTDAQATEERHIGELEGASDSDESSSFYVSSIPYEPPVNEIENLKEKLPAQSSVREESQLLLLSSYTSESDQSDLLKNAGACSKNMISQDRSTASHSKAGIADINTKSLVTGPQVIGAIGAQERVNNYSRVQCQEDILKIKAIHEPDNNNPFSNSLDIQALMNSCPLSALSETEALNSETELKQFVTESSLDENFDGETLKENPTFNQFSQLVIPDLQINIDFEPNIPLGELHLVIPDPQISVDSATNSTLGLDPHISVDSEQTRLTIQENQNNSANGGEVDVLSDQTIPPYATPSQNDSSNSATSSQNDSSNAATPSQNDSSNSATPSQNDSSNSATPSQNDSSNAATPSQNDSSNSASVRVFHAVSSFTLFIVRQVLDSF